MNLSDIKTEWQLNF